ncbi:hypothetical protein EST38_g1512 [Candolleomyces aberdarensis]|uniref:Protein kinase domain-containing protein n=1 Tax=Candolleomyces aberdarensis TaxID=2316362 RepID=A0A4Q2DUQ4_9AGAR|nr:hypothetical protein EST38_g1512 [Candolleomyces aberdarensis]
MERARNLLAQELGGNIPETDLSWPISLYCYAAKPIAIEEYLKAAGEYREERWIRLPEAPTVDSELLEPLCSIMNSIISHFGLSGTNAAREAINTHVTPFKSEFFDSLGHSSAPDIVIKACGPSFSIPEAAIIGFSNIASFFSAKPVIDPTEVSIQVAAMTACAKHMFIQQPNRFYVRSLVISPDQALLFHFDRGAQQTLPFNIHKDPQTFVRLILGLCSTDERTLGLDDSIQWSIGVDGVKTRGTLKTIGSDNKVVVYDLVMEEDPFVRSSIRGRGTTCWPVKNPNGERFIVKDYWFSGDRETEYELLKEAKGLSGVCQMVSYEDCRAQTKIFRGDTSAFTKGTFHNRTAIRIVMKAYGPSIENFSTVEQVLAALRDAIAGHKALLDRDIIHRDISPNNILLGQPDAEAGERGVLIDLDIASRTNAPFTLIRADFNMGTRMFQSLMVLRTYQFGQDIISAHDYLDDLESFFWVFSYLLLTYKADGKRAARNYLQDDVSSWGQDPSVAFMAKFVFLDDDSMDWEIEKLMDEGWRYACTELFSKFRVYMNTLARKKKRLISKCNSVTGDGFPNRFSSLLENVDEHYEYVLGLFDDALKKVKEDSQPIPDSTSTLVPHATSTSVASPATVPNQLLPVPQISSLPSLSDASSSALPSTHSEPPSSNAQPSTPSEPSSLGELSAPSRSPKRRSEDAELDDFPSDSKR